MFGIDLSATYCILCLGNRDIQGLRVKCGSGKECSWKGAFSEVKKHVANCQYVRIPCPKKCVDSKNEAHLIKRNELDEHLADFCPNREFSCQDCGKKDTYASITGNHTEVCEKKRVPCPNFECSKVLQRQNIKRHLDCCDYTVVPCKYRRLGCSTSMKRKSIKAHEKDEDKAHLHVALSKIISLESSLESTREKMHLMEADKRNGFTFKLPNFSKMKREAFYSPSFYTSPSGYHFRVIIYAGGDGDEKGTHVSVFAELIEGRYDGEVAWPFFGSITFSLLNQLENKGHYTMKINFHNKMVGDSYGYPGFISHSELDHNTVQHTQYLKDDTLYFRVKAEVKNSKPWLECTP